MEKFKDKFEKFGIDGNDDEGIFKEAGVKGLGEEAATGGPETPAATDPTSGVQLPDTIFKLAGAEQGASPIVDPYQKQTEPYANTFDTNNGLFPNPQFPAGVPIGVPSEGELLGKIGGAFGIA